MARALEDVGAETSQSQACHPQVSCGHRRPAPSISSRFSGRSFSSLLPPLSPLSLFLSIFALFGLNRGNSLQDAFCPASPVAKPAAPQLITLASILPPS